MRCSLEVNSRKHVSIENKQHRFELQGGPVMEPPLEWPKDLQKHDLDPWDSPQVSRENYAHKYDLTKPHHSGAPHELAPWLKKTTLKSMIWAVYMQHVPCSIDPLTRENCAQKYELSKVPAAGTPRILIYCGDYDED